MYLNEKLVDCIPGVRYLCLCSCSLEIHRDGVQVIVIEEIGYLS